MNRNINATTGVSASSKPASSPAPRLPVARVIAEYISATAATAIRACGISIEELEKPNSCPDRPITHCETGGLSTVMKFAGSSDPNSSAFQFRDPDQAAAA